MCLKISSATFFVICCGGFLYQVSDMSAKYFWYHVATKTSLELPDRYILHDLDLCFNYRQLVGSETKLTIRNILSKTPDSNDLIDACKIKLPNSYRIEEYKKENCYKTFNVTKYVVHSDICYAVKYSNRSHEFHYEAITNSIDNSRTVFMILLPKSSILRIATTVRPVIYGHGIGHPYLSMTLATGFWFGDNGYENSFWSDYMMYRTIYLPHPYETQCRDYGQNDCIHNCLRRLSVSEFGEVPYSLMTEEPYDLIQVNLSDPYKDMTMRRFYMHCSKVECRSKSCSFSYILISIIISTYSFKFHSSTHNSTSFLVSSLSCPDTYVYSVPALLFNEYVIFVMSCAGSWLGVSMLGLNPITWYQKRYHRHSSLDNTCLSITNMKQMRKSMFEIERQQKLFSSKMRSFDRLNKEVLQVLREELR